MILAGFQKTSLVDWPGEICATVFVAGCNFRCPFCHNPELVEPLLISELEPLKQDDIITELHKRKALIDGVCITGGEPLLFPEIEEFIKRLKDMGLKVKVDTNGTNPKLLQKLIDASLVDYVAMDIKAPLSKYPMATCSKIDPELVETSADLLMDSDVEYEFRTTVMPGLLDIDDIEKIGEWLDGARAYYLQQFTFDRKMLDESYEEVKPYTPGQLKEMLKKVEHHYTLTGIRGI
jgi:pyruvate formate lyase activating enzyme